MEVTKTHEYLIYAGVGGLAIWYFFIRKKKSSATEEEMANFFSKKSGASVRDKLKETTSKLKKHIASGGVGGSVVRKLIKRKKGLESMAKQGIERAHRESATQKSMNRKRANRKPAFGDFYSDNN